MEQTIKVGDIVSDTYGGINTLFQVRKCDLDNNHVKNGYCKVLTNGCFPFVMTKEVSSYIAQEIVKRSKNVKVVLERCSEGNHAGGPDWALQARNSFVLCQNEKAEWYGGYAENANRVNFCLQNNGVLEAWDYGCKPINQEKEKDTEWKYYAAKCYNHIYKKFRKCKVKTVEQAIQKMVEYFDAMWEVVEQY